MREIKIKVQYLIVRPREEENLYALDCGLHRYSKYNNIFDRLYLTLTVSNYESEEKDRAALRESLCLDSLRRYVKAVRELVEREYIENIDLRIPSSRLFLSHILSPIKIIFRKIEDKVVDYVSLYTERSVVREMLERIICVIDGSCEKIESGSLLLQFDSENKRVFLVEKSRIRRLRSYEIIV
ncbi:MAG: hypothetical protein ABWJ42_04370 [Sulfolobales archaeon]